MILYSSKDAQKARNSIEKLHGKLVLVLSYSPRFLINCVNIHQGTPEAVLESCLHLLQSSNGDWTVNPFPLKSRARPTAKICQCHRTDSGPFYRIPTFWLGRRRDLVERGRVTTDRWVTIGHRTPSEWRAA